MGHPVRKLPLALPSEVKTTLPDGRTLVVRGVSPTDIPELSEIYCKSYEVNGGDEHWTPESASRLLRKLYEDNPGLSLVAQVGEHIVGATFGNIRPWESGKVILEGKELFVHPDWQKHGVGNELLKERLHRAEVWSGATEVEIVVFTETEQPQKFHRESGFKTVESLQIMSATTADVEAGLQRRSKKESL
jgi:predicted N-acetyltransferase YhbS